MFRSFCDSCGQECKAISSTRFEKVHGVLGLEVTLLLNNEIGPGQHICNECVPKLLFYAAETFERSKVVSEYRQVLEDAKLYSNLKTKLERQLTEVEVKEKAAEEKQKEAERLISEAEKERSEAGERVALLNAQLSALTTQFNTTMKIKSGADRQLEADIKDNPEYIQNVERRERIRIGGK